ncbi:hypothetical protein LI328DRAFT_165843 [Trichoderma asperelloides]|nr:hypothetical protein LI328DRAFT_165843 [Trichoderma asperelloides]
MASIANQRRVKTGKETQISLTCRKRHLKCDERRPECKRCEKAGRSCFFSQERRPSSFDGNALERSDYFVFPEDHIWVDIPPSVRFAHQVRMKTRKAGRCPPNMGNETISSQTSPSDHQSAVPADIEPDGLHISLPPVSHIPFEDASGSQTTSTPVGSMIEALNSTLPIYLPQPRAALRDPEQACLLTLYTEHLSGWLALNDPRHHFSASVPQLAMKCPMLLDAIFAFSARYLSRSDANFNPLVADEYHYSCVRRLIAALKDLACASESALALSTVILRMHEMLSDHDAEVDLQRHLRGSLSLFSHNANKFGPGSLKHTAFWTYVRQEILTALRGCCPTNIDTSDRTYHVVFNGDSDDDWTNNIIWITARVINHYFGPDVTTSAIEHQGMLIKLVDDWRQGLPNSFSPLSIVTDDNSIPAINYTCIWHTVAMQFYYLCKVIFILGKQQADFNAYSEKTSEAVEHTLRICGIIRGLTLYKGCRYPGALVNAADILAYCGRPLRDRNCQLHLLELLHRIKEETTWDVSQAVSSLEEMWRDGG